MKPLSALFALTAIVAFAPYSNGETPDTVSATTSSCPSQTGVYFSDHGSWKEMEQVRSLGVHTTGVAKTAFTYGIASGKVKATFPDAKAPVQIADELPMFCSVNVAEQGRDIIVVRLEPHGKKREIQLASLRAWSGVNMQYKDSDMIKVEVEKQNAQTFLVKAPEALKSGEYIMFPRPQGSGTQLNVQKADGPTSIGGYDFGYQQSK